MYPLTPPILGAEVWEANMEKTGGSCTEPFGGQQPCSGSENSKTSSGFVPMYLLIVLKQTLFDRYVLFQCHDVLTNVIIRSPQTPPAG